MKKMYIIAIFSLIALGWSVKEAQALRPIGGWFGGKCCKCNCRRGGCRGCRNSCCYQYSVCCCPYNAFSPICCGNVCCKGCCPQPCCPQPCCCDPCCCDPCCTSCVGCDSCSLGNLPAPHHHGGNTSASPMPNDNGNELPTGPAPSAVPSMMNGTMGYAPASPMPGYPVYQGVAMPVAYRPAYYGAPHGYVNTPYNYAHNTLRPVGYWPNPYAATQMGYGAPRMGYGYGQAPMGYGAPVQPAYGVGYSGYPTMPTMPMGGAPSYWYGQ
ncbi:MAG: hypothetical protein ACK4RK_11865 [Gemmataceae bacterium]